MLRRGGKGQTTRGDVGNSHLGSRHITLHLKDVRTEVLNKQVGTHIKGMDGCYVCNTHIGNSHKGGRGIRKDKGLRGHIAIHGDHIQVGSCRHIRKILTITTEVVRRHITIHIHIDVVGVVGEDIDVRRIVLCETQHQLVLVSAVDDADIINGAVQYNTHIDGAVNAVVGNFNDGVIHNQIFNTDGGNISSQKKVATDGDIAINNKSARSVRQSCRIHQLVVDIHIHKAGR